MRSSNQAVLAALAVLATALPGATQAETIVVPSNRETVIGNTGNAIPFGRSSTSNDPARYQQLYDASEFGGEGGDVIEISEIRFRIDDGTPEESPTFFDLIEVRFSTTSAANDGLDELIFDDNIGADDTLVFSGSFTWDACGVGTAACTGPYPQPFDLAIPLTTPFVYDPAAGNLLLEVFNDDTTPVINYFLDQENNTEDSVSRVVELRELGTGNPLFSGNSGGLITQFVYTVPEAGSLGAAIAALLALTGLRRRA
jgi:hypothetical protein